MLKLCSKSGMAIAEKLDREGIAMRDARRFMLSLNCLIVSLYLLLLSSSVGAQGTGKLAVYAPNPHYLQDSSGKPIFLLGYNDSWLKQKPAVLDRLKGKVNYLRTVYAGNNEEYHRYIPDKYLVGEPIIQRANGLWDFDTWDETFWSNLRDYVNNTRDRGFIVGFVI